MSLFSVSEKRKLYFLIFLIVIAGLIETAGIASILPFMAVVAGGENIESNELMNFIYTNMGFESRNAFLIFLGLFAQVNLLYNTQQKSSILLFGLGH